MFILVSLCVQRVFVFPGQDPGHPSMGRIPIWYDPAPPLLLWNTLSVLFNFIHPVLWSTDLHQQENSQKLVARWKNFFLSFTYHTLWSACALRVFSAPTGRARCCGLCAVAPPPWRGRSSLQCVEGRTGRAQPAPNHWPPPFYTDLPDCRSPTRSEGAPSRLSKRWWVWPSCWFSLPSLC